MQGEETIVQTAVLVVDDDANMRQTLRWALEDEGLAVETAADGKQALACLARGRLSLVVLDYTLPESNSEEVATAARSGDNGPVPILMITADGNAAGKAERLGAVEYLVKPFPIQGLLTAVQRLLKAGC